MPPTPYIDWDKDHIERIRRKVSESDALGPFWKQMMLAALDQLNARRERENRYGLALMLIREGAANPATITGETLTKYGASSPAAGERR